jgi:sugar lactone lactonase YvrE
VPTGPCSFSGITFNAVDDLFVADGTAGKIYKLEKGKPNATLFVSGVPGTNGLAFDRDGNLWTGDGTTGAVGYGESAPAAASASQVTRDARKFSVYSRWLTK